MVAVVVVVVVVVVVMVDIYFFLFVPSFAVFAFSSHPSLLNLAFNKDRFEAIFVSLGWGVGWGVFEFVFVQQ